MSAVSTSRVEQNRLCDQRPGSQQALRARNLDALTYDLKVNGPSTQRQLADRTGLSAATVSNLVRILVIEKRAITAPTISSGRRATLVSAVSSNEA
ncbi:winged helix-turn-helix transcriptional regulator [Arthrobacter sp. MDT2-16]